MSIVCALKTETGVWIGSDTAANFSGIREICGQKMKCCGKYWIGVAGQLRALNLVESAADAISRCDTFIAVVNQLEALVAEVDKWKPAGQDGEPKRYELEFLITDGARLMTVGGSFGYIDCDMVAVIGSGSACAFGAYYGMTYVDASLVSAEIKIGAMIGAAIRYDTHCGGEPWTHFVENPNAGSESGTRRPEGTVRTDAGASAPELGAEDTDAG